MTKTETPKCHFCNATATAIKKDSMPEAQEGPNGAIREDRIVTQELPICGGCAEEMYDGTEIHPGTYPLA